MLSEPQMINGEREATGSEDEMEEKQRFEEEEKRIAEEVERQVLWSNTFEVLNAGERKL